MAAEGRIKSHKQMTITFTLPISCQICLGKVRQPVLCPNHHVFCSLCLDIWLNRNKQCPACRVDISPDNPIKHIIGSPLDEENSESNRTPELRRARFDLLYREYEDELEKLQKDNIILKMQNTILTTQLQDAEYKNTVSEDSKKASVPHPSPQTSAGARLLLLSRNLQEVQKLYQGIKTEMAELKQENCKLKDESVNLTRENENLRLEIAQRSPKKFGRYTVATLEAKLAEQEKEIRQLKKALERSDAYIEELQQPQDIRGGHRFDPETPGTNSRFQISLEPKRSVVEEDNSRGGPRKVLFGKVVHEETVKPNDKVNVFTAFGTGKSLQKYPSGRIFNKRHEFLAAGDFDSPNLQQNADFRHEPATSGHSESAYTDAIDPEESVQVSSLASLQSQPDSRETRSAIIPEKTSKKVHFKDSGKPSDAASFDLETPSPISSLFSESYSSASKDLSSPGQNPSLESEPSPGYGCQVKMEVIPLEGEDEYGRSFLHKNASSSKHLKAPQTFKKPNTTQRKKLKVPVVAKKVKQEPEQETMEDSSCLSVPDVTPPGIIDNLSHATDDTGVSDDFDMSMTPEMTDCLRLIDQAEKKVSSMVSTASVSVPKPDSRIVPAHQAPWSCPPDSSTFIQRTSSGSFPTTDISSGQRFASAGNNIRSWQQQFYNSLKVNPHRVNTVYKPPDFPIATSHYPLSSDHLGSGSKHKMFSFVDYNPTKDATSTKDFTFSDPIRVTVPSTDPFTSCLSVPGTSSSSSTFPSSSAFNFRTPSDIHKDSYHQSSSSLTSAAPSTLSHTHSYVTQNGRHTGS